MEPLVGKGDGNTDFSVAPDEGEENITRGKPCAAWLFTLLLFAFAGRCPFEVCRRMISELRFLNLHWEFSGSL